MIQSITETIQGKVRNTDIELRNITYSEAIEQAKRIIKNVSTVSKITISNYGEKITIEKPNQ